MAIGEQRRCESDRGQQEQTQQGPFGGRNVVPRSWPGAWQELKKVDLWPARGRRGKLWEFEVFPAPVECLSWLLTGADYCIFRNF